MHGSPNFDERHWLDLGLKDALDRAIASRLAPPFIAVLPRGDVNGAYGNTSGGLVLEQVMKRTDPVRRHGLQHAGSKEGRAIGGIRAAVVGARDAFQSRFFSRRRAFAGAGGQPVRPRLDPIDIAQTEQAARCAARASSSTRAIETDLAADRRAAYPRSAGRA
jgi:hypothetical protein